MGDCRQLANPFRSDFADGQHEVFRRGQSVRCFNFEKLFRMLLQHRRCERSEFFSEFNFLIHDPLYVGIGRVCQNTASPQGPWSPLEASLEPANDFCFERMASATLNKSSFSSLYFWKLPTPWSFIAERISSVS